MSSSINIRVSDSLKSFVEKQAKEDYETPSEYIRSLIRKDKEKKEISDWNFLRKELSPGVLATDDEFIEVTAKNVLDRCHRRKKV